MFANLGVPKILWLDLEYSVAVDFCFDCPPVLFPDHIDTTREWFGNLEVNVPKDPWDDRIMHGHGVDDSRHAITMKTDYRGYQCKTYECGSTPKLASHVDDASTLTELYSKNEAAMQE